MVPAASTPNQTNGVDLAHSAIRVAPQLLLFANSHASLYAQRCATTVMGNPNSQTPLSATAERLQIKFQRTVVSEGGGHSFESANRDRDMACSGVLDDINGYLDVAIAKLPHTSNDNPAIYMDLVVVNHVLELLSTIADARVLLLIDAVPSQAAIALISNRLPVAHTPMLAATA
jgi:hypothetical protein